MGLDSYFGRMVWNEERKMNLLTAAEDLEWPEVNLCGGMFSGNGSDGSFRGKVYANIVSDLTGEDLYNDDLNIKAVAEGLQCYVDQHKNMKNDHVVDPEWDVSFREVKDLAKLFIFAHEKGLSYAAWY